ncbi:cell envelope biogenesis protein TolA [Methylocapsa sp. D3K7]|uniref:cell envelope biogenesis protein TolA n=1 Tax=Methylocapsa sp. D3K7 TaxID=3041435 RepID=UPI00244E83EA|nr:cell envelope biogenesis protein TolA [Methylocapsa sp. D3K7]WGJ15693.1 cell envelope biogenesis protein TolA [Methylocapsa sp. D3K7]
MLGLALFSFSGTPQIDNSQESIPVAVVTGEQFSQIMKGEKSAAEVKPRQRSEKIAEIAELNPQQSETDSTKQVLAPPSPMKHQTDPGTADPQVTPKPPEHSAAVPAQRPPQETVTPATKPPVTKQSAVLPPKPPSDEGAEPVASKSPPPKPKPPVEPPKKVEPNFKPDELAKLLERNHQKDKPKATPRPKSGDEAVESQQKFDLSDIAKFLSKDTPQRKQSSGHELSQLASLGSPTASAAKMSPSLWDQLDGLLQEQYKRCWAYAGLGGQQKYIPEIHVQYTPEGSLVGQPMLLNPPSDPNLRGLAESAIRAVRRCDPLRIPAQYQPYYDQWKGRIVRFDPEEML